jgi:hypothetical protein
MANAADPAKRGSAYKELFEYSCTNRQVAEFLSEVLFNTMPDNFLATGKNKKMLN